MASGAERLTEAVFNHHMQALMARDLDGLMEDYTEDSLVIVNIAPVPLHGIGAIQAMFAQVLEMFTPEVLASVKVSRLTFDGEVAYIVWSAGATVPFASDTFLIRDGKIAVQTAAALQP